MLQDSHASQLFNFLSDNSCRRRVPNARCGTDTGHEQKGERTRFVRLRGPWYTPHQGYRHIPDNGMTQSVMRINRPVCTLRGRTSSIRIFYPASLRPSTGIQVRVSSFPLLEALASYPSDSEITVVSKAHDGTSFLFTGVLPPTHLCEGL